ncbi:AAA family ATPase [Terriglobus roseus]|uniref:AAA family ATPase n=1 Tax=Terriglobus roseus TaxID=392734 RepID=UPI0009D91CE1|nr:AAA family ATPase [Terriglobus roseus]
MALIIALDGHDGSGKTTLSRSLAARIGGIHLRPFQGRLGAGLMKAAEANNSSDIISVGNEALNLAGDSYDIGVPLVFDRAWLTVASLLDAKHMASFRQKWAVHIPTIVCWADLETTVKRLSARSEVVGSLDGHRHYLAKYRELADVCSCPILRTDVYSETECLEQLLSWIGQLSEGNLNAFGRPS